ncbi:MAG: hypothetical protein EOP92_43550, partial [Lysobacteraceae bacterium]
MACLPLPRHRLARRLSEPGAPVRQTLRARVVPRHRALRRVSAQATTVVFGEALVDDFSTEQIVGGAPFNVARHLAAFMAPQLMITRIGNDAPGQAVRAEFERFAMSEAGLQLDAMEETGRVLVERSARPV